MSLTTAYRSRLLALRAGTYRDMLRIWPAFDPNDPAAVAAWLAGASAITRRDRALAAALTREYVRLHSANAGTPVEPAPPEDLPADQLTTSLTVTSVAAYGIARRAGKLEPKALEIASVRSSGAAVRLALNGGRSVVQQTAQAGRIRGWIRVGSPQCDFCRQILGRFYPPTTQAFRCHDHCSCAFEPAY